MKTDRKVSRGTRLGKIFALSCVIAGSLVANPALSNDNIATPKYHLPAGEDFLLWSPTVQPYGYSIVDKIFATRTIKHGKNVLALPRGKELSVTYQLNGKTYSAEDYIDHNNVAGLLVLKNGKIVLERYALGFNEKGHWSSMSMVKSMTSTLVGAAIQDGYIKSLDDKVSTYLPTLKGSAYDAVSIRNLITMSSGVKWREVYTDKDSDVNHYSKSLADKVPGGVLALMKSMPKETEPGSAFHYNSGDTYLLGALVSAATKKRLADYMSEKVWANFGMEADGFYTLESDNGQEIGGSRAGMVLRDFGRFGLFVANGGVANGKRVLPANWVDDAGKVAFPLDANANSYGASGYGYSWWLDPDGSMVALGFAGQTIYINRKENLVIVTLGCWPQPPYNSAYGRDFKGARRAFQKAVVDALH
ncbi:serine hydrolase [Oleispirillum naphthae]|uniref:serine hydrolase domain-containing protein n=1 Tax=Oleispirillum naphthae TaxID=2838853 RepID=UPI0030823232